MKKAASIIGGIALIFSLGTTLLSPLCVPCLTPFLGLAAGYLAGVFDKPSEQKPSVKIGAWAGLFGGVGMLLGQFLGTLMNGLLVGPEGAATFLNDMGFFVGGPAQVAKYYWPSLIGVTACLTLFNIALMAGLGALGSWVWWQFAGSKGDIGEVI